MTRCRNKIGVRAHSSNNMSFCQIEIIKMGTYSGKSTVLWDAPSQPQKQIKLTNLKRKPKNKQHQKQTKYS